MILKKGGNPWTNGQKTKCLIAKQKPSNNSGSLLKTTLNSKECVKNENH